MRKRKHIIAMCLAVVVMMLVALPVGLAGKSAYNAPAKKPYVKPVVTVMVVNNARTTYDGDLTARINERLVNKLASRYTLVPGESALMLLANAGITDVATANNFDVVAALKPHNVDYAVYLELEPFVRKERWSVFSHGMDMTAVVPFKIIDVKTGKYLYSGKFVEIAKDSTFVLLGLGNKAVSLDALDRVLDKVDLVIPRYLP